MLRISLAAALVGVGVGVVASDVLTCDDVGALETCSSGSGSCRTVSLCPKFLLMSRSFLSTFLSRVLKKQKRRESNGIHQSFL